MTQTTPMADQPFAGTGGRKGMMTLLAVSAAVLASTATLVGGGWTLFTWRHQNQQNRANLIPALEVRISAHAKTLQNPENFLGKDVPAGREFLANNPNVRLIEGFVNIKNVGTSKTSLRVCECVRPGEKTETGDLHDVFVQLCQDPRQANTPSCERKDLVPMGPIIVSKVYLDQGKMHFAQTGRFWLTRSAVDGRSEIEPTDEIRPNAEDQFNFMVLAPGPGVYAVMFTSPIDQEESARMKEAGYALPPWPLRWDATTFIEVN